MKLPKKIGVDTSFIIFLLNDSPARADAQKAHANAKEYFKLLKDNGSHFYISSLVVDEYEVLGDIQRFLRILWNGREDPNFTEVSYTKVHAKKCAEILKKRPEILRNHKRNARAAILTDFRIVAQMESLGVEAILSGDSAMCGSHLLNTNLKGIYVFKDLANYLASFSDEPHLFH